MSEDQQHFWGRQRRGRLSRRGFVAGGGSLAALTLAACSSSNNGNKAAKTTSVATQAAASATSAGASATRAATASAGGTAAAAAPSAAATVTDLRKLSDDDFFKALPDNPPKTWKDSDIKTGGQHTRLHLAIGTFDFHAATTSTTLEPVATVYNRLVRLNCAQGMKSAQQPELQGDLAAKWERPDATTMLLTLAPNIKWQNLAPVNGRAFSVDDIKATFDRGKSFAGSQYKTTYAVFDSVEDPGNNQVRLKLAKPEPIAELHLTNVGLSIMPRELTTDADTLKTKMVGTGPFQLKSYTPNVEAVFEKNSGFWKSDAQGRKLPYLDGLTYQVVADLSSLRLVLDAGKADSYSGVAAVANFDNVRDLDNRHPDWAIQLLNPAAPAFTFGGHYDKAPWSDVRVRRAFSLIFPRDEYSKSLYRGYTVLGPYFPWPFLYDKEPALDQYGPWMKYDLQQAKQLLAAAGFGNGMTMDLEWFELGDLGKATVIFQERAAQAGVKLNLVQNPDQPTHFTHIAQKNWSGLTTYGRPLDFVDPAATARSFAAGQSQNGLDVNDDVFNGLWTKLSTATGDERKSVGKQILDRQLDQVFDVPFPYAGGFTLFPPSFKNYVATSWSSQTGRGNGQFEAVWKP